MPVGPSVKSSRHALDPAEAKDHAPIRRSDAGARSMQSRSTRIRRPDPGVRPLRPPARQAPRAGCSPPDERHRHTSCPRHERDGVQASGCRQEPARRDAAGSRTRSWCSLGLLRWVLNPVLRRGALGLLVQTGEKGKHDFLVQAVCQSNGRSQRSSPRGLPASDRWRGASESILQAVVGHAQYQCRHAQPASTRKGSVAQA